VEALGCLESFIVGNLITDRLPIRTEPFDGLGNTILSVRLQCVDGDSIFSDKNPCINSVNTQACRENLPQIPVVKMVLNVDYYTTGLTCSNTNEALVNGMPVKVMYICSSDNKKRR